MILIYGWLKQFRARTLNWAALYW